MSLYPSLEDMKVDQMAQVNRLLENEKVVPGCKIMYYTLYFLTCVLLRLHTLEINTFKRSGLTCILRTTVTGYIFYLCESNSVFQAQADTFGQAAAAAASTFHQSPAYPPNESTLPSYPQEPPSAPGYVYPELNSYMGLEFDEQTLRENMPEYISAVATLPSQNVSCSTPPFFSFSFDYPIPSSVVIAGFIF